MKHFLIAVAIAAVTVSTPALGRGYLQHRAGGVQAAADMVEVGVDLFFREVDRCGNTLCRDGAFAEKSHDGMTGRLLGCAGNHWFSRGFLHGASLECKSLRQQCPFF